MLASAGMNVARLNMSHGCVALAAMADHGVSPKRDSGHGSVTLHLPRLCRSDHTWHRMVIDLIKAYNKAHPEDVIAILLDTKGPEVRSGDVKTPLQLSEGDKLTFTCRVGADGDGNMVSVNYDDFVHDVAIGDVILVDGGIMSFRVDSKVTAGATGSLRPNDLASLHACASR